VRQTLHQWGQEPSTVDDAALLVTELVSNAIRHAGGTRIAVYLAHDDARICCLVLDEDPHLLPVTGCAGPGPTDFPQRCAAGQPHVPSRTIESGRGLRLVDAIASRWGCHLDVRTGWSRKGVWFELPTMVDPRPRGLFEPNEPRSVEARLPVRRSRPAVSLAVPIEDDPAILHRVLDVLRRDS